MEIHMYSVKGTDLLRGPIKGTGLLRGPMKGTGLLRGPIKGARIAKVMNTFVYIAKRLKKWH